MNQESQKDFSSCLYTRPASPSFSGKGFYGYTFGPLRRGNAEILLVESEKGHDTFFISKKLTRCYYILDGSGSFTMNGVRYPVTAGMLVEVPPKVEYTYSGKMSMIAVGTPRWMRGNERTTRWNPDVTGHDMSVDTAAKPWLARLLRMRIAGKSPVGAFLRVNQSVWNALPVGVTEWAPVRGYGAGLHALARIQIGRAQALSTYFLRNRAELELIRRLVATRAAGDVLRVTVLGCSTGAEAYSIAWTIRSARPDLKLVMQAIDISRQAVEFAERGIYPAQRSGIIDTSILSAMTAQEIDDVFERKGEDMRVKDRFREGIRWSVGDAGDPALIRALGSQDMVVANNFLCHMDDAEAERCLHLIGTLVRPRGYLFVSGVAMNVRSRVASSAGWEPVQDLIEEIHEGDRRLGARWPCHYAAPEPMNKKRRDWKLRYAAAYRLGPAPSGLSSAANEEAVDPQNMVGAEASRS